MESKEGGEKKRPSTESITLSLKNTGRTPDKSFHYAKFQKNLDNAQKSEATKRKLEKESWDETEKKKQTLRKKKTPFS